MAAYGRLSKVQTRTAYLDLDPSKKSTKDTTERTPTLQLPIYAQQSVRTTAEFIELKFMLNKGRVWKLSVGPRISAALKLSC